PFRFRNENELRSVNVCKLTSNSFSDYLSSGDEWRWWGGFSFVLRRSAFAAAGGFFNDLIKGEDADLALRFGVARGFTQVTAPFTFAYREHEASAMKNLSRTLAGTIYKIRAEQAGRYPGGVERAHQRWRILTRHVRPITLECLRRGMRSEAVELYRATLR